MLLCLLARGIDSLCVRGVSLCNSPRFVAGFPDGAHGGAQLCLEVGGLCGRRAVHLPVHVAAHLSTVH